MSSTEIVDMDELADAEKEARRARGDWVSDIDDLENEDNDDDDEVIEDPEDEEDYEEEESEDDEVGEEEEDEEGEDEDQEEEDEEEDIRIPKYRLDEEIGKRRVIEEKAAWLEEQLERILTAQKPADPVEPPKPSYSFEEKETEYVNLIIEGEAQKAAKLRREIDQARETSIQEKIAETRSEALKEANYNTTEALLNVKFEQLVDVYETKYPFLNDKDPGSNQDAINLVNNLMMGYMAKGQDKLTALKEAVDQVAPAFAALDEVAPSPKTKNKIVKEKERIRKKAAVKKSVRTQKRQPPKGPSGKRQSHEEADVSQLSEHQFRKLSKREIAEARGDFYAGKK